MTDFSLARPDIINKLKERDWFVNCIRQTYLATAKKNGFTITISKFRVYEAHDLWVEDLEKLLNHGIEDSSDLDVYKHAGFLSYWLRRRLVINSVDIDNSDPANPQLILEEHQDNLPDSMKEYLQFHNERSAFDFGVMLCFNYKINELKDEGFNADQIQSYINDISKKASLMAWDVSVLMKQKSVSPHTLYLVLKCLFLH